MSAFEALAHVRARAGTAEGASADLEMLRARAQLTVNFHPDRPGAHGHTAAAGLAADGVYRTQFETGTSSGGLDPVMHGARSRWEHEMFGGAYDDGHPAERPRYGVLDLLPYPDGGGPRFGSTHLRLRRDVLERCTFSWGDSVTAPQAVGTWDRLAPVLAAAAAAAAPELVGMARPGAARLDSYVEAQIHGGLHLSDVEVVVTDPSYQGTAVGEALARACERDGAVLEWHAGYVLAPDDFEPEFRGERAARLAHQLHDRLAERAVIDPELLGRAAIAITARPTAWNEGAGVTETLQQLKYVWHHLAAFGYQD